MNEKILIHLLYDFVRIVAGFFQFPLQSGFCDLPIFFWTAGNQGNKTFPVSEILQILSRETKARVIYGES